MDPTYILNSWKNNFFQNFAKIQKKFFSKSKILNFDQISSTSRIMNFWNFLMAENAFERYWCIFKRENFFLFFDSPLHHPAVWNLRFFEIWEILKYTSTSRPSVVCLMCAHTVKSAPFESSWSDENFMCV